MLLLPGPPAGRGEAGLLARILSLAPSRLPQPAALSDDFTKELKETENATIFLANLTPPVSASCLLLPAAGPVVA